MNIDIREIGFPTYNGLESQFEYNVYKYLEETIGKNGYAIKIKKTEYPNVDKALTKGGELKCDAYIFNNEDKKEAGNNLIALFELESNEPTSKLKTGIGQVINYCKLLNIRYSAGTYTTANKTIKGIVFDGQFICVWEYNIETKDILPLIGDPNVFQGVQMDKNVKIKLLDMFPTIEKRREETSETKTIKDIKGHLRANRLLQSNKSFLMTILAAIYGKKKDESFVSALSKLEADTSDNESCGILKEWKAFVPKIDYDKPNSNTKTIIKDKLYTDAKSLWLLSQNKNMDLYGFIYEELAEEKSKQDEGEFYTSRHIIAPIISSVLQKYNFPLWDLKFGTAKNKMIKTLLTKKIVDPFCGSGGFIYEFLRYLKKKYQLTDSDINKIAKESLYGFDKNHTMAAFLNMYLIGDGATNLCQVTSSINWQNMWNYTLEDGEANVINNIQKLEDNIVNNKTTFKYFLNALIDWNIIKDTFQINLELDSLDGFFEYIIDYKKITEDELFYKLIDYKKEDDCVLKYLYDLLLEYTLDKTKCPVFEDFKISLGNTDLLITNIPYGPVDDLRLTTKGKGTLESLALKQCIDLLKPSTFRKATYNKVTEKWEDDANGVPKSNNDGGIATIIIPNGIFESENNKELRDYIFRKCNVLAVIKLPTLAFAPYALVQTFVITIQKKALFEFTSTKQEKKCFFYIVDNDGKANSRNRFATELIGTSPIRINHIPTTIHEYLHDDLAINIEQYPEGYMSKLERAWIYGQDIDKTDIWNQNRYSEKWNGKGWNKIADTEKKWAFSTLKEKDFEKQMQKENKDALPLFQECIEDIEDFESFDIKEQKNKALCKMKRAVVNEVSLITVTVSKNAKVKINILPAKIKNLSYIKNIIKDNYNELLESSTISNHGETMHTLNMQLVRELFENINIVLLPKYIQNIDEFFNKIDEIEIIENDICFFTKNSYKQYTLVPENYLDKKDDFMPIEDIISNIRRLRNMLGEA